MVYKKYRCRYFDSSGRPLNTTCNQGSSCRFLHPDDPNWPGLKPMDKRTSSATYSMPDVDRKRHRALDTDQETGLPVKPEGSPEQRHATPLVSQNDLFLRRKCENEEKKRDSGSQSRQTDTDHSRSRGRDSKRGREHDSRNTSTNSSKHYYDKTHSNFKRLNPGATSERSTKFYSDKRMEREAITKNKDAGASNHSRDKSRDDSKTLFKNEENAFPSSATSLIIPASGAPRAPELSESTRVKEKVKHVVDLFRELSRLSNQATQDVDAHARNEHRLKAFTELSSTLSKVSTNAAAVVMPNLADVLLQHAEGKQRLEDNWKAMSGVWDHIFETFVREVSHAMDNKLKETLQKIREEGELMHKIFTVANVTQGMKRPRSASRGQMDSTDRSNTSSETQVERAVARERKRRCFDEVFPSSPINPTSSPDPQPDIQEILCQMKSKIDEQTQALQKLSKENNELKASLYQRTTVASCF